MLPSFVNFFYAKGSSHALATLLNACSLEEKKFRRFVLLVSEPSQQVLLSDPDDSTRPFELNASDPYKVEIELKGSVAHVTIRAGQRQSGGKLRWCRTVQWLIADGEQVEIREPENEEELETYRTNERSALWQQCPLFEFRVFSGEAEESADLPSPDELGLFEDESTGRDCGLTLYLSEERDFANLTDFHATIVRKEGLLEAIASGEPVAVDVYSYAFALSSGEALNCEIIGFERGNIDPLREPEFVAEAIFALPNLSLAQLETATVEAASAFVGEV